MAKDFSTFKLLETNIDSPVGAFDNIPQKSTGTDLDEYNQWIENTKGQGIGDIIYDDIDDARDAAEFSSLTGTNQSSE